MAILILGIFTDPHAPAKNILTAEERLATLFRDNGMAVITSSQSNSRVKRLVDTVSTVIKKKNDYDIAIVPLFGTWPSFIWQEIVTRLLKLFKKKIMLGIHGGSIPGRIEKGANHFNKALLRADLLYAPSEYLATYFGKRGFNITILENPVRLCAYRFCQKQRIRPRIIWMRAFSDIYDPLMAVRVAKMLAHKYDDFKMVMAGSEGPLTKKTKQLAEQLGVRDKISFPGYLALPQKQLLAQEYDIYISTSRIDNTPVSLTEFMQFGLPVVAVKVGGISSMIKDGLNGLLADAGDEQSMAGKIEQLITDQALAQAIVRNACNYVERYDEINVLHKWKKVLND